MRIVGCDLHAAQQTIAMLDGETGELVERTLKHEGTAVRDFYAALPRPVVVGIEATGSMGWFLRLMEELGVTCQVGDPAKIRKVETRRQKHDRRDAALILELLTEHRFPSIWMPPSELCDLRALLRHRDQWVRMRAQVKNALQGLALAHGVRRGAGLWTRDGQATLAALPLAPHAGHRRSELQTLHDHLTAHIDDLDQQVGVQAHERPQARRLMTHPGVGPRDGLGDGSVPWRSLAISRCQGVGELRRDDSKRVLERRSSATREAHEAGQSVPAVSVVRGGHSCRAT